MSSKSPSIKFWFFLSKLIANTVKWKQFKLGLRGSACRQQGEREKRKKEGGGGMGWKQEQSRSREGACNLNYRGNCKAKVFLGHKFKIRQGNFMKTWPEI